MHEGYAAACLAFPEKDTIFSFVDGVLTTLPRENIWHMQTPQVLSLQLALAGHELAKTKNLHATDDIALILPLTSKIKILPCSEKNFKITYPHDLLVANLLALPAVSAVGIGEDSHQYDTIKKGLWLGGVFIEQARATRAYSDGDVILHALYNALSSALGQGSIGDTFSDQDESNKNISSSVFIKHIMHQLQQSNRVVKNVSVSLIAKEPRITPWISKIKKQLGMIYP